MPDAEVRAKYTQEQIDALGAKGHAFKNADGSFSYPIDDRVDLENAIHAVGRGNADHDAIRKYIMGRARDLGCEDMIPDNWNADGSLKQANSDTEPARHRSPIVLKRAFSTLIERPPSRVTDLQVRLGDSTEDHVAHFRGYASTTGVGYAVNDWLGEYRETIQPGAFLKTLREATVPLLFNHDGMPLASYRADDGNSTSTLSEDRLGLLNEAQFDRRSSQVNDMCIALQRRDLNKMSFSFRAINDAWNDTYDDRSVGELALYDTSIVTYPANPTTTAELRSAMRVLLGREGTGLMFSIRTALDLTDRKRVAEGTEPLVDNALRAISATDEIMCRRGGYQGRARMFLFASLLAEFRQGKVLSAANETLLRQALSALHEADNALNGIDHALDEGQAAISSVLDVANPDNDDPDDTQNAAANNSGLDTGAGGSGTAKNPLLPLDGAGPRSEHVTVQHTRRLLEKLRNPA